MFYLIQYKNGWLAVFDLFHMFTQSFIYVQSIIYAIPFQITSGQKMTEVTSRDHEASLISPTTEAEGTWKFVKKL